MAVTAELIIPPQALHTSSLTFLLVVKNTGAADTINSASLAATAALAAYIDFTSIAGMAVAASTETVIPFAATFSGTATPEPQNPVMALVLTLATAGVVLPIHNAQTITTCNPLNQGEIPSQPTSFAATTGSTIATLAWTAPAQPGTDLDGNVKSLLSYLAIAVPQGSTTDMPVFRQIAQSQITFGAAGQIGDTVVFGTGANKVTFTAATSPTASSLQFQDSAAVSADATAATFVTTVMTSQAQAAFATLFGTGAKVVATKPSSGVVLLTLYVDPVNAISPGVAQPIVAAINPTLYTITNSPASGLNQAAAVIYGLTNGVLYDVSLFAVNAKGNGQGAQIATVTPA